MRLQVGFLAIIGATTTLIACSGKGAPGEPVAKTEVDLETFPTQTGTLGVYTVEGVPAPTSNGDQTIRQGGVMDRGNPFFQDLGKNGRRCVTCHQPDQAFGISPPQIQALFNSTCRSPDDQGGDNNLGTSGNGLHRFGILSGGCGSDALFRPVDGANSPNADVSTDDARRSAYSLLLNKGLIRIGLPIPDDAEFTLEAVNDPYNYASASELSLYRRPLAATNLPFIASVMWDTREQSDAQGNALHDQIAFDLMTQADNANLAHAEAKQHLDADTLRAIVNFEMATFSAQVSDSVAGDLTTGVNGGPFALSRQPYIVNENRVAPDGLGLNNAAFNIFDAWASLPGTDAQSMRRASIARGQAIFNNKTFFNPADPSHTPNTCSRCHSAFNAGSGTSDNDVWRLGGPIPRLPRALTAIQISTPRFATPDLPMYTLKNKTTGAVVQSTDPGQGLITGKWLDVNRFKVPSMRGLAARAPYFHNGFAATLDDVVTVYDQVFQIHFTAQERTDLIAFMSVL